MQKTLFQKRSSFVNFIIIKNRKITCNKIMSLFFDILSYREKNNTKEPKNLKPLLLKLSKQI